MRDCYYSEERIKECLKYTTAGAMRKAINIMLSECPDITILPSENGDEEMYVILKKKGEVNE